jgi:hypothetical protein
MILWILEAFLWRLHRIYGWWLVAFQHIPEKYGHGENIIPFLVLKILTPTTSVYAAFTEFPFVSRILLFKIVQM